MTITNTSYLDPCDAQKNPVRRRSSTAEYQCFQNYYHGHQLLSPNPHYIANVRSSINHWQLRDLVKIDSLTGSLFSPYRDLIRVLLINGDVDVVKSRTYLKLPYFARSFNFAPGGLFVIGGLDNALSMMNLTEFPRLNDKPGNPGRRNYHGLFSVYSPAMATEMTFILGEMINNAVTIYPDPNSTACYTSYVCNNDSNLYVVDISDSGVQIKRSIVCEPNVSLNNVIQSPDQRLLAATGDLGSIFLLGSTQPRATIKTIPTKNDSGFGLSFHNNEHTLACAFQNGSCLLYDIRKPTNAFHEIMSTRPNHQSGAFRCCKFLKSLTHDLLAVSEHVGRIHLIDLRDLRQDRHQVVVFPLALDQFSQYRCQRTHMKHGLKNKHSDGPFIHELDSADDFFLDENFDQPDHLTHARWQIYGDGSLQFSAPLVYDYQYLTNENPNLFKGYKYEPPSVASSISDKELADVDLNTSDEHCEDQQLPILRGPSDGTLLSMGSEASHMAAPTASLMHQDSRRYFHYSYMQSANHVNGEMQLSGVDWFDNQLYVVSEDGGVCEWDVNARGRRSFGSFSFA